MLFTVKQSRGIIPHALYVTHEMIVIAIKLLRGQKEAQISFLTSLVLTHSFQTNATYCSVSDVDRINS